MELGIVVAVFFAGLRHGFDIDHIAAIGDITSSQTDRRRSFGLSVTYALGHMLVLFVLGLAAVFAGQSISAAVDSVAGRIIGFTLVALGLYVVYSLIRFRRDFRMRSRWMLVVAGARRALAWIRPPKTVVIEHDHDHGHDGGHEHAHAGDDESGRGRGGLAVMMKTHRHTHRHVLSAPADPFTEYGVKTSFLVGMVHGVGAETPTQVLLFTTAAGVAGSLGGVLLVASFVVGLFLGNAILAVVTLLGFAAGKKVPLVYMGLAGTTALLSVYIGLAYLLDSPEILPGFLGG